MFPFVTGFFHLACFQGSMFQHPCCNLYLGFIFFSRLNDTTPYGYTSVFIHPVLDGYLDCFHSGYYE